MFIDDQRHNSVFICCSKNWPVGGWVWQVLWCSCCIPCISCSRARFERKCVPPLLLWTLLLGFCGLYSGNNENIKISEVILVGILSGLLFLTRLIALVILPVMVLVWWIKPF